MRRSLGMSALVLCAVLMAPAASAVATSGYAAWQPLAGSSNQYTTRMQLPAAGFAGADVASDSRSGSVGVQSGASVWLAPNPPVGQVFGSSQNQPYLNLRPKADNATAPSRTTYTFDSPTPPAGWAFVLGDIDADEVTVSAKDVDGNDVSAAQLGFAGAFNLCDTSPRPGGCSASAGDVPSWSPGTRTLTGNPTATDTFGASGWFRPSVSLSSLTLTFTRRSGFPVYQTWFAALARTIGGTVSDASVAGSCSLTDVTVVLAGPDGEVLESVHPDASGAYSFGEYATQPGYDVSVEAPAACAVVGPQRRTVSNADADGVADFDVRAIVPFPVSGQVTAAGDGPVAGVTVTLHLPGGGTKVTTTDADGHYLFDDNLTGSGYLVTIAIPDGYTGADQRPPFDVVAGPVTGQDFVLTANPDVSGTVTGGGAGLGAVTISLTPSGGGSAITTTTDGDGNYVFEKVPAGSYVIAVEPPPGYLPETPLTGVVVTGDDVTDQDFALERPGAIDGTVHLDSTTGPGQPGVPIEIDGPGGTTTVTTDGAGDYFTDGLSAGTYEIQVVVPDGYSLKGLGTHTATITEAGEIRSAQDFVIVRVSAPTPTPTPAPGSGTGSPGPGTLPDVGAGSSLPLLGGLVLLATGLLVVRATRRRRPEFRQTRT